MSPQLACYVIKLAKKDEFTLGTQGGGASQGRLEVVT